METLERILAEHPFFKGLEPSYLQLVIGCASNVRFDAGEFIFREGGEANEFYLMRKGKVALEIFTHERGSITIQTFGEGEIFGMSWLIPPYRWHFDACALEPTLAITLDGKCLRTKCEEDHNLGYEFLKRYACVIGQRLQAKRLQLLDLYGTHS